MLLIDRLIPIDIVLPRNVLNLLSQHVPLLDQRLPFRQIKTAGLVEFFLTAADGKVERRSVGYFAVMIEEPEIAADEGGETDEILSCERS